MEIKLSSTIVSVLKFLKKEFNINLGSKKDSISKFRSLPVIKAPTHVNKKLSEKVFFVIDGDTIVFELVNFFQKQRGLSIELRNKNGIKLPDDIMLKQVSDIPSMPSSSRTIEDYLKVTTRLANSGDYYDSDWAVRILESAAFKANNNSEKWLIIDELISFILKNNQLSFKQTLTVIVSCFSENEDYIRIYNMLLESNNKNAIIFANKLNEELKLKK